MSGKIYPSDLTDEQWDHFKNYLPSEKPGGRPREVDIRQIVNGIFYVNKTSCPWRWLPKDYPAWQTVYTYFRDWRLSGAWEKNERAIEKELEKRRGKRFSSYGGDLGLAECEDYFSRRNKGVRWWEESGWPQAPHIS